MAKNKEFTLQAVEAFRTVWALCDVRNVDGKDRLSATHYAVCLQGGRVPTWGVFDGDDGRLLFLFERRSDIEGHRFYRKKVWRIKQASNVISGVVADPWSPEERFEHLQRQRKEELVTDASSGIVVDLEERRASA